MIKIQGIDHVAFNVRDLDKSVRILYQGHWP